MPEWSKGADLRSAGRIVRVGSNPTSGTPFPWGISSIGRVPALQAGGTGIETPMLHFGFPFATRVPTGGGRADAAAPFRLAWMAEWSKALDSSSSIARCVGSNPTSSSTFLFLLYFVLAEIPPALQIANSSARRLCTGLWSSGMILL